MVKKEKTKRTKVVLNIADKSFIKTWQDSSSAPSAAGDLGITVGQASRKAMFMRKHGVPLKTMQRGRSKNWNELIEYAKSLS